MTKMSLKNVISGKQIKPWRCVMHSVEGCGKSTLGSNAPEPIFLGAEDGTAQLDVMRFPQPESWEDVLAATRELRGQHGFKTFVVDTLDWIEPLVWAWVCANVPDDKGNKHDYIENYGYGKGYTAALDVWRRWAKMLDGLRDKGMNILLLAHSHVKLFNNPAGDNYDRYEMKLQKGACAMWREWGDAVLFANYEELTHGEKGKRAKGIGEGRRVIFTDKRPTHDAKNRHGLPYKVPFPIDFEIDKLLAPRSKDDLLKQVHELMPRLSEEDRAKAEGALPKADSEDKLAQLIQWMTRRVG